MFKRSLLLLLLTFGSYTSFAQYISPTQLKNIYTYWLEPSPQHVDEYITETLSSNWKTNPKLMHIEEGNNSVMWMYEKEDTAYGLITVMSQYNGNDLYNKAAFTTDSRQYYGYYLQYLNNSPLFTLTKQTTDSKGVLTRIYKSGKLLYILSTEKPDEKGVTYYTIVIQGINQR